MSLQVWLPFTDGTLKQQGLSSETVTSGGTINLTDVGKLGKCATFGSAAGGITIPASTMTSFTNCSVAFWLKINGWGSSYDTYFQAGTGSTPWNNYIFGFLRNNTNSTICFTISNGSSASNANYLTSALSINTWYHIALIYETGKCKIYLNGALDHEYSTTIVPAFDKITKITLGRSNNDSSYQTQCSINDFRIYDHCLSPMEVKELSKGLVLHYPLNRGGWGQNNLIVTNSMAPTSGTSGWSRAGTDWANSNVVSSGASNGHAIRCTYSGTAQVSGGIHHPTGVDKTTLTNGATYTLSARIRASKACVATFQNELMISSHTINLTTDWQIYTYSNAIDNTKEYHSNIIYVRAADATQNMWIECDWIKLEEGSIATPWCPNSSDTLATTMGLNSTTEYDCSGFCNNGTRTGTFSWTSDTPKYNVSTYFNGSSYIKTLPGEIQWSNYDNLTIAAWIKPTVTPSSWTGSIGIANDAGSYTNKAVAISNYGGKFSIHIPNGSSWGTTQSTYTIPLNTWHHCVATISGTTVNMYVDGVLNKTFTADFGTATNHTNPQIEVGLDLPGSDEIYTGYYSDVRIYATALSADDVKSLYQNSAYIDSNGNVYGAVHSEV